MMIDHPEYTFSSIERIFTWFKFNFTCYWENIFMIRDFFINKQLSHVRHQKFRLDLIYVLEQFHLYTELAFHNGDPMKAFRYLWRLYKDFFYHINSIALSIGWEFVFHEQSSFSRHAGPFAWEIPGGCSLLYI